LYVCFNHIIM
jgi:hypothetical protein